MVIRCVFYMRFYVSYNAACAFTVSIILTCENIVILNYKGISLTQRCCPLISMCAYSEFKTVSLLSCMCFFLCVITGGRHAVRAEEGPGSERNCSAIPPVHYSTYILTLSLNIHTTDSAHC